MFYLEDWIGGPVHNEGGHRYLP
ncbi:uncharacterized protein METZ01_LOCUS13312 [marine metagenome]|uniref:Uncharacterized protein n=1 Tax=marine metagenome TaxID=408172 RepID=A0A381P2K7_9ZZZZ